MEKLTDEMLEMFGHHDQMCTLKQVLADINTLADALKLEKFRREFDRTIDPEDDDVPYYLKMAVDELASAVADIKSAIDHLEFEEMSLIEREEYFRHCFNRQFA